MALASGSALVPEKAQEPEIKIEAVSKIYPANDGDVVALRDVSIDVGRGEFLSVLGPSGCGKSTLMLLVSGLERASSGHIEINGQIVDRPFTEVGIVFQDHALYDADQLVVRSVIGGEGDDRPRQGWLPCSTGAETCAPAV